MRARCLCMQGPPRSGLRLAAAAAAVATTALCCAHVQANGEAASPASSTAAPASAVPTSTFGSLGVALYPGMETVIGAHRRPVAKRGKMVSATFRSADPAEQVTAFYRQHLGRWFGDETRFQEAQAGSGVTHLQASAGESQAIEVSIRPEGARSIVSIQALVKTH